MAGKQTQTQGNLPIAEKAKQALVKNGNGNGNNKLAQAGFQKTPQNLIGLKTDKIKDLFSIYKSQIAMVIPKIMTPERLINVATNMVVRTPELASCTTGSIIGAMLQAATLGLDPTPALSYVFFIPRKRKVKDDHGNWGEIKEAQFMISYRGLLALLRRTGQVETAYSYVVYEKDQFDFQLGLEPNIVHKPHLGSDRGNLIYVYAVIKFKEGGMIFEVMSREDVYKVRQSSESKNSNYSPWKNHEAEMWRKTVLRRLCKFAPVSIEDTQGYHFEQQISADEGVIDADKIDPTTKELPVTHDYEDISEAEVITESDEKQSEKESKKEPEQGDAEESTTTDPEKEKRAKAHVDFSKNAEKYTSLIEADQNKLVQFQTELGNLGYERLEDVEPANYGRVLNFMKQIVEKK